MSREERLEELKGKQKELFSHWHDMKVRVTKKLYKLLTDLNQGPLPILYGDDDLVSIDVGCDYYGEKEAKWKVRDTIYFKTKEGKREFASDIELYITDIRISVNVGTCGTWDLRDEGQWSRILLLKNIFDHQDDIIRELSQIIDLSEIDERAEVSREIDKINREISREKEQAEEAEFRKLLVPGKLLAELGQHWVYPDGEHGKFVPHYYHHELITKLTEVSVLTQDADYKWITHRRKLKDVMWQLKNKRLFIVNSKDDIPPEEEDSK